MSNQAFIIRTDGSHEDFDCPDVYKGQADVRKRMSDVVGGWIEHVRVLFNDKPAYMIVNETGAVQNPQLPINEEASRIYHTASANREGIDLDIARITYPLIYGDVIVLDGVKVR